MPDLENKLHHYLYGILFLTAMAAALFVGFPMEKPRKIDSYKIHDMPFKQKLVLQPGQEQEFYFRLKTDDKKNYASQMVGVAFLIPADDDVLLRKLIDKIDAGQLPFDVSLVYYHKDGG
ncbi:hypothetical protein [Neisseria iguanae]|nr:hypothetical protein [Neisseria iguanae]